MFRNNNKRRVYETVINSITKASYSLVDFTGANKKRF